MTPTGPSQHRAGERPGARRPSEVRFAPFLREFYTLILFTGLDFVIDTVILEKEDNYLNEPKHQLGLS